MSLRWLNVCTSIYVHQIQPLSNVFVKSSKCVQSLVVREYKIIDLNEHSISVWVWMLIIFFLFPKERDGERERENYFRLKCFIIFRVCLTGNSLQRFQKQRISTTIVQNESYIVCDCIFALMSQAYNNEPTRILSSVHCSVSHSSGNTNNKYRLKTHRLFWSNKSSIDNKLWFIPPNQNECKTSQKPDE